MTNYQIIDKVTRETGELLENTDADLAWGDEGVYVLEPVEENDEVR